MCLHAVRLKWRFISLWVFPFGSRVSLTDSAGWTEQRKDSCLDGRTTHSLSASISFPLSVSASHLLPHTLTSSEESILLTSIISPYLSLSLSLPLHSGHSVPIEYACCGLKWVPQQSYHVLIMSVLVASLILLHPFSPCNWTKTAAYLSAAPRVQMLHFIISCHWVYYQVCWLWQMSQS